MTDEKIVTIALTKIAADLAEKHEMSKKATSALLADFVELVVKHLKKGAKVRVTGLGIFQVKKRPARLGRNPLTGEQRRRAFLGDTRQLPADAPLLVGTRRRRRCGNATGAQGWLLAGPGSDRRVPPWPNFGSVPARRRWIFSRCKTTIIVAATTPKIPNAVG